MSFAVAACTSRPAAPVPEAEPVVTPKVQTLEEARALRGKDEYEPALRALTQSPDETTRRRALALDALELFEEKRYEQAIPMLQQAAQANPAVAPFLRLRIVDAAMARNDVSTAIAVASEIVALGNTSATTVARLRLPGLYAQTSDRAAADEAFAQAMTVPIDELTEGDFVTLAKTLDTAGRGDLAAMLRLRLLNDYPQGRYTEQTYALAKSAIAALTPEATLALAQKLAKNDRYDQALELFARIPTATTEARAARLRALFNSRHYAQLLGETQDVDLADPSLILLRARAAWRSGMPQEFLAGLARVEKSYPASAEAIDAKVQRAKYYITDEINYAHAVADLEAAIAAGATGTDGENIWNLGWTYTLAKQDDEALRVFDRYIKQYPDGDWKTNSLFWSAKIHDRHGRVAERDAAARRIAAEFPCSYYAYRAKELWPSIADQQPLSRNAFPDLDAQLAGVTDPRIVTVNELLEIDLPRAAAREMKLVAAQYADNPGVQFLFADVYVRGGEPFKANGVLQRRFRDFVRHGGANIPRRFWQILFPLAYWDAIQSEAAKRGLDPYLVASIIRQESGFEPSTVSNAGAVGLMQIMPEEASRIAAAGGIEATVTRDDLFDPAKNIAVGAAEFAQKLAAMRNNQILAIAAYNAGENPVGTWLEKTPFDDVDLFVEAIPYGETRLYVKTVTRNRFEYRRIYERTAVPDEQPRKTP
ncbi:MAG TPA: lytic transglycosylase domain-containing protein [Thermoanaerobaculia bacterium]|jgi:soluble lytic murein transglycosylase